MMHISYDLKIPKERIAVLIGSKGAVKTELEDLTSSSIHVDSSEGDVHIEGKDSVSLFSLREVIKAIGRGFNPDIAILLLRQDYVLDLINLPDYAPTRSHMDRLKGRVIGRKGKSRDTIEKMSETFISVYGKTIGIVGSTDRIGISKQAIESLLSGAPHSNVFKFLERSKSLIKKENMLNWYEKR